MADPSNGGLSFNKTGPVDVAVVTVTYNSVELIDDLLDSIRQETADITIRVIVADNASSDGSLARASSNSDVIAIGTGGNLGYSAGINVAMEHVGPAESIMVLNPDLRVRRGAFANMLRRLRSNSSIGMVVPLVVDGAGRRTDSLYNEPKVLRSFGDAVLGPFWRNRPSTFSEWVRDPRAYETAHPIDWATGAAMLVARRTAARVGEWDERFFLYSEETDYCRRVRDNGEQVWFEPSAVVVHTQGASGRSQSLDILLEVNRLRYVAKHTPNTVGLHRTAAILSAWLRAARSTDHRELLRYLRNDSLWHALPKAQWDGRQGLAGARASVVIPAHNEAKVISSTLSSLSSPAQTGALEVIVCCNGCTDDTTAKVAAFPGVRLIEIPIASKVAALNAGDIAARAWPRIYLDADIELPAAAVPTLVRALNQPGILAGRPPFQYDTTGAAPLVRSYYRARRRVAGLSGALWGAGVYALTESGHRRLGKFPSLTADDLYVDALFNAEEKAFPLSPPAIVRTPRTVEGLMHVLTRSRRGASGQSVDTGRQTVLALVSCIRGPMSLLDSTVFVLLTLRARIRARRVQKYSFTADWERDESSRA